MSDSFHYPKYWAERPEPIERESISSWMIRTAMANLTTLSLLLRDIQIKKFRGKYFHTHIDLDFNWIPEIIQLFVEKTNISEKKLREMSLFDLKKEIKELTRKKYDDEDTIFNLLRTTRWMTTHSTGLRFCSLCLKENKTPYFRKI